MAAPELQTNSGPRGRPGDDLTHDRLNQLRQLRSGIQHVRGANPVRRWLLPFVVCTLLAVCALLPTTQPSAAAQITQATPATVVSDTGITSFELRAAPRSFGSPLKSLHWWYTYGYTDCNGEFPNAAHIKLWTALGGTQHTIEPTQCPLLQSIDANVVRDGQYFYYYKGVQIQRKPIGALAGTPSQPLVHAVAPTGKHILAPLAIDSAGLLYFAAYGSGSSSIYRM
ncbi:MAG: hypothetical protein ACJ8CR_06250 [Roseiflexaceae bacterium]